MPMRILYIEDDTNIAEIYTLMIQDRFPSVEISHFENGMKALQELKTSPEKYNLIISDFNLTNISGGEIFKFVSGQMLGIPFIVLSGVDCSSDPNFQTFFTSHVRNALLLKPASAAELTEKIEWCLEGEDDLLKIYNSPAKNNDERIEIRSDTFLKINSIPCDIYLKLSNQKFIKIINKNDIFESILIQKLIMKGVTHFYINRSELSAYGTSILNTFYGLLKSKKHKGDEHSKSQMTNKAIDILKNNLVKCGFNPAILRVADEVASMQVEMIKGTPELNKYLEKYQNFRKINTEHTRLVSYIVVAILQELTWDSDSTLQRMCTAALLHDLSLTDEFLEKLNADETLSNLTDEEKSFYYRHPEESAHIAKHFESIAAGVELYVMEHHELPDGKGFPNKMNYGNIHPLSATLHLADLTADLLWKHNFNIAEVKEQINNKRQYYIRGFYRKPYEALVSTLKQCNDNG